MTNCLNIFKPGSRLLKIKWAASNMTTPAMANLNWAITRGWADCRANLVAVEADAQKMAKSTPADIHLSF